MTDDSLLKRPHKIQASGPTELVLCDPRDLVWFVDPLSSLSSGTWSPPQTQSETLVYQNALLERQQSAEGFWSPLFGARGNRN